MDIGEKRGIVRVVMVKLRFEREGRQTVWLSWASLFGRSTELVKRRGMSDYMLIWCSCKSDMTSVGEGERDFQREG